MSGTRQAVGYAKGRSTRTEILSSAIRVFAQKGYFAASLKDILHDVGITKGAFYHHWQSKEDLALELLAIIEEDYYTRSAERLKEAHSAWDRIVLSLELVAELNEDGIWIYRDVWLALMFFLPEQAKRLARQTIRQNTAYLKYWISLMENGQIEGCVRTDLPASLLAEMVQATLAGVVINQRTFRTSHSYSEITQSLMKLLQGR